MKSKNTLRDLIVLLLIFSLGLWLRLLPWGNFITADGIYLLEGDNYEHLRKIIQIVSDFPFQPPHDYFVGFPVGSGTIWAPLFDLTMAVLVKFLSFFGLETVLAVALLPPFIGAITIIPLYLWVSRLLDRGFALTAALIYSLLPASIFSSIVGRIDNELIEPLLLVTSLYTFTLCLEKPLKRFRLKPLFYALISGLLLALSLLYWRGAIIWWGLLTLSSLLICLRPALRERALANTDSSEYCDTGLDAWRGMAISSFTVFAFAAFIVAIVALTGLWGTESRISFNKVSWFHVISGALAAFAHLALLFGFYIAGRRALSKTLSVTLSIIFALASLVILYIFIPSYFEGIFSGLTVVGASNVWIGTIGEYQPLFTGPDGGLDIIEVIGFSTIFILLAPLSLLVFAYYKRREFTPGSIIYLLVCALLFLLTVLNGRYENLFIVPLSVSAAFLIYGLSKGFILSLRSSNILLKPIIVILLTILFLLPSYRFYKQHKDTGPALLRGDLEESLLWLRDNTPPSGNVDKPYIKPLYGVMARWEYGGWIEHIAERPSIATLYGIETHGLLESAKFFLADNTKDALAVLDANEVRYILLGKTIGALSGYARLLEREPEGYAALQTLKDGTKSWSAGPKYLDLAYVRLYLADGVGRDELGIRPVEGLRLIYESSQRAGFGPPLEDSRKFKIFERVKGAIVKGKAKPGDTVTLEGTVRTNRGRTFAINQRATADSLGRYSFNLYYPTISMDEAGVGVLGRYRVRAGQREISFTLSDSDVIDGASLTLMGP